MKRLIALMCLLPGMAWGAGAGFNDTVIFCGELANAGAFYAGPAVAVLDGTGGDHSLGSTNCDALGNATEATVDNDIDTYRAYRLTGMMCQVSSAPSNAAGVIVVFHGDTNVLDPSVTCTVAQSETSCSTGPVSTEVIEANEQVAIESTTAEDLSTADIFCRVGIAWE